MGPGCDGTDSGSCSVAGYGGDGVHSLSSASSGN